MTLAGARPFKLAAHILAAMEGDCSRGGSAWRAVLDARAALRNEFVQRHGWVASKFAFSADHLSRGVLRRMHGGHPGGGVPYADHSEYFRAGRRPAAIISQPYNVNAAKQAEMFSWAALRGLAVEFPDFPGWHFPGRCQLCVFRARNA